MSQLDAGGRGTVSPLRWVSRTLGQLRGVNPFLGDIPATKVPLVAFGRPSLPFPHPWNFREPIAMLASYYWRTEGLAGSGKHNRYLDFPGMPHVLVTREPAVIRAVLKDTGDQPGQFDRDTRPAEGIARATGENSILYANGPEWRRQKKLAAPPFCRSSLFQPEEFHEFERTFRKTVADRLEALRLRQQESGRTVTRVSLELEIKAVMLEMLVNNFFGSSVPSDELRDRFVPALDRVIDHMVCDTVAHTVRKLARKVTGLHPEVKKAKADYEALTDIALAGREKGLGLWKQFKAPESSNEKLRSNIRVFLAGALEATTSFASWALAHLASAPDVQERIYQEVKDMDVYNPENLSQAVTLNRTMEETLRLTPSLYFLPRWSTVDTWIATEDGRKLFIPRGSHVILDVWHANRCEEFWGKAATGYPAAEFAPDRWEAISRRSEKDFLHFGFGYGPRVCPGKFLGQLEVGLVVGALVKVFKFRAAGGEPRAKAGVSTKPSDGVLVDLELRHP